MAMSSPPRRRRKSSFFGVLKYNKYKTLNDGEEIMDEAKSNQYCGDVISKTELNREDIIQNHIAEMIHEVRKWGKTYQAIKSKYMDAKQCKNDTVLDWVQCKDCLSEEDVVFLNSKVNYEDLVSRMNQMAERIEIVKCKLEKTDANVDANIEAACQNIRKIKEDLCYLLLNCEESSNFSILDDSGNYSMDNIKLETPPL